MFRPRKFVQIHDISRMKFSSSHFLPKDESRSTSDGNNIAHPKENPKSITSGSDVSPHITNEFRLMSDGKNIYHPKNDLQSISENGVSSHPKNETKNGNDDPPHPKDGVLPHTKDGILPHPKDGVPPHPKDG